MKACVLVQVAGVWKKGEGVIKRMTCIIHNAKIGPYRQGETSVGSQARGKKDKKEHMTRVVS